jgi:hypothetical protein
MTFRIEQATVEDAAAIAQVFIRNRGDLFILLQLEQANPGAYDRGLADRIANNIQKPGQRYIVARDDQSGKVISYAQWMLPNAGQESFVEIEPAVCRREQYQP